MRRRHDQDHERNLEVHVGQGQAPEAQEVEARLVEAEAEQIDQEHGHEARPPERREEREGQRHAGEVRGDAREGQEGGPDPARQPPGDRGVGEEEPDHRAADGRRGAHLEADPVRLEDGRVPQVAEVLEREVTLAVLEGADDQVARREDQEEDREGEERQKPDELPRGPTESPAHPDRGSRRGGGRPVHVAILPRPTRERWRGSDGSSEARRPLPLAPETERGRGAGPGGRYLTFAPTTLSHCLVMISLALACCSSVGKTAFS